MNSRIKTRYFAFTLNNYTVEQENKLQEFIKTNQNILHCIYGRETAPTTGTKHLQGAIATKRQTRNLTIKNSCGIQELHIEPCKKVYEANISYCKKSNDTWEFPDNYKNVIKENKSKNKSKSKSQTLSEAGELAKQNKWNQIELKHIIKHEAALRKLCFSGNPNKNMFLSRDNKKYHKDFFVLFHGTTGTGKSYRVDLIYELLNNWWKEYCGYKKKEYFPLGKYDKFQNKWWENYDGEKFVYIEEANPSWWQMSGNLIKRWFDEKPFSCEIKGGSIKSIRPWFIVVTSNYNLFELCYNGCNDFDPDKLYNPLKRRITEINITDTKSFYDWPNLRNLIEYFDTYDLALNTFNKNLAALTQNRKNQDYLKYLEENNYNNMDNSDNVKKDKGKEPEVEVIDLDSTKDNNENSNAVKNFNKLFNIDVNILEDTSFDAEVIYESTSLTNDPEPESERECDSPQENEPQIIIDEEPCFYCATNCSNHCTCGRKLEFLDEYTDKDGRPYKRIRIQKN